MPVDITQSGFKKWIESAQGFEAEFLEIFGENKSIMKNFIFSALKHMVWAEF